MMKKYFSFLVISLCTFAQIQPIIGDGSTPVERVVQQPRMQQQAAGRGRSMQPSAQPVQQQGTAATQGQNVAQPEQQPAVAAAVDAAATQKSAEASSLEETAANSNAAVGSAATSGTNAEGKKKDDEKQQEVKAESKKLMYAAYIGGAVTLGLGSVAAFYILKFGGAEAWSKFVEHMVAAGKYTIDNPVVNWTRAHPWTSGSLGAIIVAGIAAAIDWKREQHSLLRAGITKVKNWYHKTKTQAPAATQVDASAAGASTTTLPAAPVADAQ